MNRHACRAPGCGAEVDGKYLMCRAHWEQVPKPIQTAVLTHWQEMQRDPAQKAAWVAAAKLAIASLAGEIAERGG